MKFERYLQPIDLNFNYFPGNFPSNSFSLKPKRDYIKSSKLYKPNGKREINRRKAQMLKIENKLLVNLQAS